MFWLDKIVATIPASFQFEMALVLMYILFDINKSNFGDVVVNHANVLFKYLHSLRLFKAIFVYILFQCNV